MKKVGLLAAAVLACVACEQGEKGRGEERINLVTGIEAQTRAPDLDDSGKGNFAAGDGFLQALSGTGMNPLVWEYTVGRTELFWPDLNLLSVVQEVRFAGCYPIPEPNSGKPFRFDVESAPVKDLLLAPAVSARKAFEAPIRLSFVHALHRLRIVYRPTADYSAEELRTISTVCKAKSVCRVDPMEGKLLETFVDKADFSLRAARRFSCCPLRGLRRWI